MKDDNKQGCLVNHHAKRTNGLEDMAVERFFNDHLGTSQRDWL